MLSGAGAGQDWTGRLHNTAEPGTRVNQLQYVIFCISLIRSVKPIAPLLRRRCETDMRCETDNRYERDRRHETNRRRETDNRRKRDRRRETDDKRRDTGDVRQ